MSHDEMIAVIAHHRDGGKVRMKPRGSGDKEWQDRETPTWNFGQMDYCIKPEPRSLWVVRFQSGNIAGTYTDLASAESRARDVNNSTILEFKEVLP